MSRVSAVRIVQDFLKAQTAVATAVTHPVGSTQIVAVYGENLPPQPLLDTATGGVQANKPATAIVVAGRGGPLDPDIPLRHPRILISCYASSKEKARVLAELVGETLHDQTIDMYGTRLSIFQTVMPIADIEEPSKFPFADIYFDGHLI